MARLISSRSLDFVRRSDVGLRQASVDDDPPLADIYAASAPGAVQLRLDSRGGSAVSLLLERWDARPPEAEGEWDGADEMPWQEIPRGGPLRVDGVDALDVDGLGRARVSVLSSRWVDGQPTRWLVRFFPDPARTDALAGPPRRLPSGQPVGTWVKGLEVLGVRGWRNLAIPAFTNVFTALTLAQAPLTSDELLQYLNANPRGGPRTWETVVVGPTGSNEEADELLAAFEEAAGSQIRTQAEVVDVLLALGVLAPGARSSGASVVAASPDAPCVWDVLHVSQAMRERLRLPGLQPLFADLSHVVRWAPDGRVTASPRQVAERLDLSIADVRSAAARLVEVKRFEAPHDVEALGDDDAFDLQGVGWHEPSGVPPTLAVARHDELVELVSEFLTPAETSAWLVHERASVRLVRRADDLPTTAVLGGLPSLPDGIEWPRWNGVPLHFLASVDLAALHAVLPGLPLPATGALLFFLNDDEHPPQVEGVHQPSFVSAAFPSTKPGWRVIHVPAGSDVRERPLPAHPSSVDFHPFARVECAMLEEATLPSPYGYEHVVRHEIDHTRLERLENAAWDRFGRTSGPLHRIAGWADPTQTGPAGPVALADAGLVTSTGELDYRHPDAERVVASADDGWILLLQLDTDVGYDAPGWMWGDGGVMFFYVQPGPASRGDFSNVWMNWDCG